MQRLLSVLRLLLLLLVLLMLAGDNGYTQAQDAEGLVTSTTIRVRLRDGPGTDWYVLTVLEAGEFVRLDARAPYDNNIWVRGITYDGRVGWLYAENITTPVDQLAILPEKWIDDPFTLPPAPPPVQPTAPPPPPEAAPVAELVPGSAPPVPVEGAPVEPVAEEAASAEVAPPAAAPVAAPAGLITGISANARAIYLNGQQLGNRANVFSKIGDSITVAPWYLFPIGAGAYNLQGYGHLQSVINHFSAANARTGNSFANQSLAANNGWTTLTVLDPNASNHTICAIDEAPLVCEYRVVKPSVAIIMLGTNDLALLPAETFRGNLAIVVQTSINMGVIPVLSTVPPRSGAEGAVAVFNQIIIETARAYDVPLWNYHGSMVGIYAGGLSNDGIHPSSPPGTHPQDYAAAANFTPENLNFGFTMRNLGTLQVLDAIWRQVLN
jgi:hypothetical protein